MLLALSFTTCDVMPRLIFHTVNDVLCDLVVVVIKMLELDDDVCEWLLGDLITEDMGSLIGTVADAGDVDRIKKVIENPELDEFQRSAALRALTVMYVEEKYPRDELFAYLGHLLVACEDDESFITYVVDACYDMAAGEHYERIRKLYEDDKVDTFFIGSECFDNDIKPGDEELAVLKLKESRHHTAMTDTVKAMHRWACFREKPSAVKKKVGRNDPAPAEAEISIKDAV